MQAKNISGLTPNPLTAAATSLDFELSEIRDVSNITVSTVIHKKNV